MRRTFALAAAALLLAAACSPSASSTPGPQPSRGCGDPASAASQGAPPASAACLPADTPAPTSPAAAASPAGSPLETRRPGEVTFSVQTYPVTPRSHPHDVAVASDGGIWYTGQRNSTLGWLDPATGEVREAKLPSGAAPHGVITGPDGAAWVTDVGLDAIIRVTPGDFRVDVFSVPDGTAPHTPVFDHDGILWFTGAAGFIGRLDPETGERDTFPVPRGNGPYGIAVTPSNEVWFVSLEKSYLGRVDKVTGEVQVFEPPTVGAGTRRVWSDSKGRLWISYWNAGKVAAYDPAGGAWQEWDLPGDPNQAYSMYVDEADAVWVSDFGQNAIVRFDPETEVFDSFPLEQPNAAVRQMLGRPNEAWGAESGIDRLIVIRSTVTTQLTP